MATSKDWTATAPDVATLYFADGNATDWCVHSLPTWCRTATIYNRGSGILYASIPALTSTAAATDACVAIPAGGSRSFFIGGPGSKPRLSSLSTWGADGAAHAMDLLLEAR